MNSDLWFAFFFSECHQGSVSKSTSHIFIETTVGSISIIISTLSHRNATSTAKVMLLCTTKHQLVADIQTKGNKVFFRRQPQNISSKYLLTSLTPFFTISTSQTVGTGFFWYVPAVCRARSPKSMGQNCLWATCHRSCHWNHVALLVEQENRCFRKTNACQN